MKLIDHPDNPIPAEAVCGYVKASDGVRLRYAHWPALGPVRHGTVTVLQGRAEFIEKYFEVISDLRNRGFAVITFDWRGQGGSGRLTRNPRKGHVSDFGQYRDDLRTVLKQVSLAEYPGPHFALAHSTGGAILLSDTARLRTMLDRAVITAPLLALPKSEHEGKILKPLRVLQKILSFGRYAEDYSERRMGAPSTAIERFAFPLARLLCLLGLGRSFIPGGKAELHVSFEKNLQTSDPERFKRFNEVLRQSPELGIGAPTIGWVKAAANCMAQLNAREFGPSMKLPCLIVAAGHDRIVSTPAIEDFCSRTAAAGYLEIPGAEHEILMEKDRYRDQLFAAFDAFVPGKDG